jgi:hypothetical protein
MSRQLQAEDARIVDMLLDSGNFATDASVPQAFSHTPEMFNNRFVKVEKVLRLLDEMPAMDPPANLIARTFDRIDQANQHHHEMPSAGTGREQRPTA